MIKEDLENRNLPNFFKFNNNELVKNEKDWENRKSEIKQILCNEEYGYFPENHVPITTKLLNEDIHYCGGNATLKKLLLTMHLKQGTFSFPINIAIPKNIVPCPAFLYISFYREFPNKYLPVEEICDKNFAVISFCYEDVSSDNDDFSNGLSYFFNIDNNNRNFGKILIWSWAAMHIMDYIQTLPEVNKDNIAIVGHSKLGKTALLTGAFDTRFKFTISNDSGQSGASISRDKIGERVKDICDRFPFWFCNNYSKYSNNETSLPFDQHYLLSLIAPRYLYISSASDDSWADWKSEFLCGLATNPIYDLYNKKGLIYNKNSYPNPQEKFHNGYIGYHLRHGWHYLSRYDWNLFIEYINSKM